MGAYDTIQADTTCARCGRDHQVCMQSKFFDPDYDDQEWFCIGIPRPKNVDPTSVLEFGTGGWMPVRPHTGPYDHVAVMADDIYYFTCECGMATAPIVHYDIGTSEVTLTKVELADVRAHDFLARVDFVETESLWCGDYEVYQVHCATALAAPVWLRAALARSWLDDFFDDEAPRQNYHISEWAYIKAPVRCETCGVTREFGTNTRLVHGDRPTFLGPLQSGDLAVGQRVPFDDSWLAGDVDRGFYVRMRHPVPRAFTMLATRQPFICTCGAFRPSTILHFLHHQGEIELEAVSLRAIRSVADIADLHFIEAHKARWARPAMTREQIADELVALVRPPELKR